MAEWKDKWLSFPSGHSSYTVFAMTYVSLYINTRMGSVRFISHNMVALRPLIIFVIMLYGLWVSLTRVADHRHRLSDILAGAALGAAIAILTYFSVTVQAVNFKPTPFNSRVKVDEEAGDIHQVDPVNGRRNGNINNIASTATLMAQL